MVDVTRGTVYNGNRTSGVGSVPTAGDFFLGGDIPSYVYVLGHPIRTLRSQLSLCDVREHLASVRSR